MTIRAIWGFDHLPQGNTVGATGFGGTNANGFGILYNNYGLVYSNQFPTYGHACILNNELSFINVNRAGVGFFSIVSVDSVRITDGVSPKSIIGFRFTTGKNSSSLAMMTIGGLVITPLDFGIAPNAAPSFVEIVIDRSNKKIHFFNNSVLKSTKIFSANSYAPSDLVQFMQALDAIGSIRAFSKFYFLDDTEDDTPCSRLGEFDLHYLPVVAANTNDWVVSDSGSVVAALNSQVSNLATTIAPAVSSPNSMVPISMNFAPVPGGNKYSVIHAVDIVTSIRRNESPNIHFYTSTTLDGVSERSSDLYFSNKSLRYGVGFGIQPRTPNDKAWNVDRLSRLTYTIHPLAGA